MSFLEQIEELRLNKVRLYPGNPRRGDVDLIASSLEANGQYRPVVVQRSTGYVLAGNHTVRAARKLGWKSISAVVIEVDDTEAKRIVLADNRTADAGTYDQKALADLLASLESLEGTGYGDDDLAALLENPVDSRPGMAAEEVDAQDTEPPEVAVTLPGDVWVLGRHRLMCGDGIESDSRERVLSGSAPSLVYTDPPYGIKAVPKDGGVSRGGYGPGKSKGERGAVRIPAHRFDQVANDDSKDTASEAFAAVYGSYPDAAHVWWGGNHYAGSAGLPDASCWLVWDKVNGASDFADCELAWTNGSGAVRLFSHMWKGMLRATERAVPRVHPTQKPVALAVWAFGVVDKDKGRRVVLDLFAGSGSTLLAAELTDRDAVCIEIVPAYCDVICRRYQQTTGVVPVLERTGEAHDFVGRSRGQ